VSSGIVQVVVVWPELQVGLCWFLQGYVVRLSIAWAVATTTTFTTYYNLLLLVLLLLLMLLLLLLFVLWTCFPVDVLVNLLVCPNIYGPLCSTIMDISSRWLFSAPQVHF
jgi:hypothetical protein